MAATEVRIPPELITRAVRAGDRMRDEMVTELASQASANVHRILDQRIKRPTPYYETQVRTDAQVDDRTVHDSGVIYGAWLEGISERNRRSTFKGYAAFARGAAELRGQVDTIVQPIVRRHLAGL